MKGLKLIFTRDEDGKTIEVDNIIAIDASVDGMLVMTAANGKSISIGNKEYSKLEVMPEE